MVEGAEFDEVKIFLNQDILVIRNIFPMQLLNVMYLSEQYIFSSRQKKSCIQETPNLLTNADSSTNIFVPIALTNELKAFFFLNPPPLN